MKKKFWFLTAAAAAVFAFSAVACDGKAGETGVAYGLVNGGTYVGKVSITLKGDDVTAMTLQEVCFPTDDDYATVGENDIAEEYKVGDFYKEFKLADVVFTYSEEASDYVTGTTSFTDWVGEEENAKTYFEAVVGNKISVVLGDEERTDLLCNKTLNKDENGYWPSDMGAGLGWKENRDNTVKYVLAHGVDRLENLTLSDGVWVDGDISTGATWSNLNNNPEGYISYVRLILNAAEAARGQREEETPIGPDGSEENEGTDAPDGSDNQEETE